MGKRRVQSTKSKRRIYLDHAAATPLDSFVASVMQKTEKAAYGNPSALHHEGLFARTLIEGSRKIIAEGLGVSQKEIIFTSGATESNALVVRGVVEGALRAKQFTQKLPHIIVSAIEHASILETCKNLVIEKKAEVTYVPVQKNGVIDLKALKESFKVETVLVSIQYVNNEIGVVQPLKELAKLIRHHKKTVESKTYPYFHTDAVQAVNYCDMHLPRFGVDFATINSSKIYGPKGVGALYVRRGSSLVSQQYGGVQEFGLRAGTENTIGIFGFGEAFKKAQQLRDKEGRRLTMLRDWCVGELQKHFPEVRFNGDLIMRIPNNINFTLPRHESEELVLRLDARGIAVSAKSACDSASSEISHVIKALYHDADIRSTDGSLRITMGRTTTREDLKKCIQVLVEVSAIMRNVHA